MRADITCSSRVRMTHLKAGGLCAKGYSLHNRARKPPSTQATSDKNYYLTCNCSTILRASSHQHACKTSGAMSSPFPRVVTGAPFSVQRVDVGIAVDFGLVPASSRQSSRIVQGCNVYCEVLGLFYRLISLQVLTDYESEECLSKRHSKTQNAKPAGSRRSSELLPAPGSPAPPVLHRGTSVSWGLCWGRR